MKKTRLLVLLSALCSVLLLAVPSATSAPSPLAFGGCFHDRRLIEGDFRRRYVAPLATSGPAMDGVRRFLRCMTFARLDEFRSLLRGAGFDLALGAQVGMEVVNLDDMKIDRQTLEKVSPSASPPA